MFCSRSDAFDLVGVELFSVFVDEVEVDGIEVLDWIGARYRYVMSGVIVIVDKVGLAEKGPATADGFIVAVTTLMVVA